MTIARMLPIACLLAACGPSTPTPDATPEPTSEPISEPKPKPTAAPTAEPEDVGSFAAAPTAEFASGARLLFTYEGATADLAMTLVPAGKSYTLRFKEAADKGAHVIEITPKELKAGEPASFDGGKLFLQLNDGKNADGTYKLVDVTSSCTLMGSLTLPEIPKVGQKAKGSVDATIACKGVNALKSPFTMKGDFKDVPLSK